VTTVADGLCAHCGLDALDAAACADGPWRFCCHGCRGAWRLIHDAGLERYYSFVDRAPPRPSAAGVPARYEEFDHPAFAALHTRPIEAGLREVELYLEGVHCASCVWLVERLPLLVPGAVRAELDVPRSRVRLAYDPAATALSAIAHGLATLGYRPHPYRAAGREALRRAEDRAMLGRIGVAGALAGNVMMVAVALYAGWFGRIEAEYETYFRWVSLLLTAPAILGPGRVFFTSARAALVARRLHMDVPIALALAAGFLRGAINTVRGSGPIYFDGVATLVFLLLVGRFLQQRAQRAATDSTELLASLSPRTARLLEDDGAVREVPSEALLPGMIVEVRHGDAIPADGTIVDGTTTLDLSLLSGESLPVAAVPGDTAWAGTIVRGPRLTLRVERTGEETRVGRLALEVEAGAARRAPLVRAADRLAGRFVAVVLGLAAVTWITWSHLDPSVALDHAIAMLIVTCPCALALATPLAMTVAIGRAARAGILIRGGDALERLARPGRLVLDKTGTLTEGRLALASWSGDARLARAVVALERHARHPVAEAFVAALAAPSSAAAEPEVRDVSVTAGGGVEGRVDGRRLAVGAPAFVRARLASGASAATPPGADEAAAAGRTPVWVSVDGRAVASAGFADRVRPESAAILAALRARGFRPTILSGDAPAAVDAVGEELGFAAGERRAGATPEEKLEAIERLEHDGGERVVMVGDGVNDAAAMARASVGIGVRGGAEACLAAADVFLARPGLGGLVPLVDGSARTLRVIRRGIALSLAYNLVGAGLTLAGRIDPLVAAILMPLSSLSVVLLAWRSRTFDPAGEAA
jgi:Cu2+-exporting ATPase